jgi:hypothetical protein
MLLDSLRNGKSIYLYMLAYICRCTHLTAQQLGRKIMKAKTSIYVLLCILALASSARSKRGGAPIVEPVTCAGLKFIAPNNDGIREYVDAYDITAKKKKWDVTILTNSLQPGLEQDVQWVYIKKLECEKDNLRISDERDRQFLLNLKTKQIRRLNK